MKRLILCADDYALSPTSTVGILNLLNKKRLSAVSCVVNNPLWVRSSKALRDFRDHIDIGLHFNLTEGYLLSEPTVKTDNLNKLIIKAYTGRLKRAMIEKELAAQIQAFSTALGRAPDFIDGHQHIQQLPVIRDVLLEQVLSLPIEKRPYIRCSFLDKQRGADWKKRLVINNLGAKKLRENLIKNNIAHNPYFSGVYDFSPQADYAALFRSFLSEISDQGMIMCHPALGIDSNDLHAKARQREYEYFTSDFFINDCKQAGFELSKGCY